MFSDIINNDMIPMFPTDINLPSCDQPVIDSDIIKNDRTHAFPPNINLPSRGRPNLNTVEVLIADDVRIVCKLLTSMLRELGVMKIDTVDNGLQAISYFFHHQPHIVFLDIDMPILDGLSALKQIKRWTPECFVCIISANSTLINVRQAKADGVDAFLVKPINILNVKRVIEMYKKKIL